MVAKTIGYPRPTHPKCSEENLFGYTPYPTNCPCCKGTNCVVLLTRDQVQGKWGYNCMAYECTECHAMVGADSLSTAMGVLGDTKTRHLRTKAHRYFDRLWKKESDRRKFSSRSAAYRWLARTIDVEYDDCHFANMDAYTLLCIINILKEM